MEPESRAGDPAEPHLWERGIVATTSPYAASSARLSPASYNTEQEVDMAVREIDRMA